MRKTLNLINNAVLGKTIENVRKHSNLKLVTLKRRKKYLINQKTQIIMNKPIYLGLSISDLSKTVIYEFWYDYVKPKYSENARLCHMDTDSFMVHVKTDDIYKDIAEGVETRFGTSKF